jgi:tetratricopeptide (TPR) repeat protein
MYLQGRNLRLRKSGRRSNPRRVFLLVVLIAGGLFLLSLERQGVVKPIGEPTLAPTRIPSTYAEEAEAQFASGNLKAAIAAYNQARVADPRNLDYSVALARIQIYAEDYEGALATAEDALLIAPNSAKSKAIYAWALDWNVSTGCACKTLPEAEAAAVTAIALDTNYAPAHAYYSEILNDSGKWSQGFQEAENAIALDPNLLEAHRALGYAYESIGQYADAINSYLNAVQINPNLISLYIQLGLNYRTLGDVEQSIFYFGKANAIDPENVLPYLYLSRTHYQNDELGTAIQYLERALALEPDNADIHGRMGLIFFRRRNYEGAAPELALAVEGGTVDGAGNPLTYLSGEPVVDINGEPVTSSDGITLTVESLGFPTTSTIMEYYYTYGNLLAYLGECGPGDAPKWLGIALEYAPEDPTVLGSYEESMAICNGELTVDEALDGTATPEGTPAGNNEAPPEATATP